MQDYVSPDVVASAKGPRSRMRRVTRDTALAIGWLLAGASQLLAAPVVGPTSATPATIALDTATTVTVTSQITDPTVITTSVQLLEVDATGRTLRTLGALRDDGTGGDARAGDGHFTTQISVREAAPTQRYLRVSAAFRGVIQRSLSSVMTLTFSAPTAPVGMTPNPLSIDEGAEGRLAATLSPAPRDAGSLTVSSADPQVASVPSTVGFAAGQTEVQVPVSAIAAGTTTVSVMLNGRTASAVVRVTGAAPAVASLAPPSTAITAGAAGTLTVRLSSAPATDIQVALTSSDSNIVRVPADVTVAAGQLEAAVPLEGVMPGTAQVTATLGASSAASQITVTPAPPRIIALVPPVSNVTLGASTTLQLTISASQTADTAVELQTDPNGILAAPATVSVPAGQTSVQITVDAVALGQGTIRALLGESSASAVVNVVAPPLAITALEPSTLRMTVGATGTFTVRINAAQPAAAEVVLESSNPLALDIPASVTIPAGLTSAEFVGRGLLAGDATITASANGTSQQSSVHVAPQSAAVAGLVPSELSLQEGATGRLVVSLNAAQESDTVIALSNDAPAVAQMASSVTVPAGALSAEIGVTALLAGRAVIVATVNGTSASAVIDVTAPPPTLTALTPSSLSIAKGSPGVLRVSISRGPVEELTVALTTSDRDVAAVAASVSIAAGATFADFPITTVGVGTAAITASLDGSSVSSNVVVSAAEPAALKLAPETPTIAVGQTVAFAAVATMTDGTTQGQNGSASWSSSAAAIATIDANGVASGSAAGETEIGATVVYTPVAGGGPVTLTATTTLTVETQPTLTLTASVTEVAIGESAGVTVTSSRPAPAGGLAVTLTSSGAGTATFPAQVVIPGGATSVAFTASGVAAGDLALSANASGFQGALLTLRVAAALRIDAVQPSSGTIGAIVELLGAGFDATPATNVVSFPGPQGAPIPASVLFAAPDRLTIRVPATAESGPIRLAATRGVVTSPPFTVTRERDFQIIVSPATVRVFQSSSGQAQVQLSSIGSEPFTGLVSLAIESLPAGASARFTPAAAISGGQTVSLELSANGSAQPGTYRIGLAGTFIEGGQPLVRRAELDLIVQPSTGVTGVKGRFVTPAQIGIPGIIVRGDTASGPVQTTTDAAGNFQLTGLTSGQASLRFDATPANPLYPIWPYTLTLPANQIVMLPDWTINPPPPSERFTPIANSSQTQVITDPRYPGLEIRLPAGATITGWDGVPKTRIAVEKIEITKLPIPPPPAPTGAAYQLYFGTPMGGVPSVPIPITLPNDVAGEPGEALDVWYFDGSPMAQSGTWRIAGAAIVTPDGKAAAMQSGSGVPRFCGVCGVVCLGKQPPAPNPPPNQCTAGNPVELSTGQELPSTSGLTCRGLTPIETGLTYNPVDAFDNIGGTSASMGFGWTLDYDISFLAFAGPQKRLILPGNRRINFVDDGAGNYKPFDDPRFDGAVMRARGGVNEWELTLRDGTRWRFGPFSTVFVRGGPPTFLTEIIDPHGNSLRIDRRADGRITSVGSAERGVSMTYGTNGFVSEIRDTASRVMRYAYTANDRLSTVTDPDGRVTRYTYVGEEEFPAPAVCPAQPSVGQRIKTITYPGRPNPTENWYGPGRRVLRQVAHDGTEHRFAYRVTGACVTHVSNPAVVCQGTQCPSVDSFENFEAGWRIFGGAVTGTTVTQPNGAKYSHEFNTRGVTLARTDSHGQRTTFAVDAANRVTARTDALGRTWRYEYDAKGNVTREIDPLGRAVTYTYDAQWNKVTSVTRRDDNDSPHVWRFTYDAARGTMLTATNAADETTRFSYTSRGQLASVTGPLDQTTAMTYSDAGDLATIVDPLGNETRMEHDGAGRNSGERSPLGSLTRWTYNGVDALKTQTDPLGLATRFDYDPAGRPAAITNARGNPIESYTYAAHDRLEERTDALGRSTTYEYDSAGRLSVMTDRRGLRTTYAYDQASRLSSVERPEGVTRYSYDAVGRVLEITDPEGTIFFTYDFANRLTREIQATSALRAEITYEYDALDRRTTRRVTGAPGDAVRYGYDRAGRLTSLEYRGEQTTFAYDAAGRLHTKTLPNGIRQEIAYDTADRILSILHSRSDGATVDRITYEYDANGQRINRADGRVDPADRPFVAEHDAADRITTLTWTDTGQHLDFAYDAAGNLATRRERDTSQLTVYTWDSRNRLVAIDGPNATARFAYDAIGRRIARAINSVQANYIYDGRQAIGAMAGNSSYELATTLQLDGLVARYGSASDVYYLTDALNSVVGLSASDGSLTQRYNYSAYGVVSPAEVSGDDDLRFTGRERDGADLYYYRTRYYDHSTGRFTSEDLARLESGDPNFYRYVLNSPTNYSDPTGEWAWLIPIGRYLGPIIIGGGTIWAGRCYLTGKCGFDLNDWLPQVNPIATPLDAELCEGAIDGVKGWKRNRERLRETCPECLPE